MNPKWGGREFEMHNIYPWTDQNSILNYFHRSLFFSVFLSLSKHTCSTYYSGVTVVQPAAWVTLSNYTCSTYYIRSNSSTASGLSNTVRPSSARKTPAQVKAEAAARKAKVKAFTSERNRRGFIGNPFHQRPATRRNTISQKIRVVPDIQPFLISGIRQDIRFHSPDIRLEKLFKIKNSFDK